MIAEVTHGLPTSLASYEKTRNRAPLFICSVRDVLRQQPPSSTGTNDAFAGLICGNRGYRQQYSKQERIPFLRNAGTDGETGSSWRQAVTAIGWW